VPEGVGGHHARKLLGDLVGDGLKRLAAQQRVRAGVVIQIAPGGKVLGDLLGLIVGTSDLDHFCAVEGQLAQLLGGHAAGQEDPQADARPRAERGVGRCLVAR